MKRRELKTKRKRYRISQFALSKTAKVSRFRLGAFEAGYLALTPKELVAVTRALEKIRMKGGAL
jgi:hypothetical protein